jgi:predicted ATPase/DNA-binding winged helix-turn-helix (wHTH) protein
MQYCLLPFGPEGVAVAQADMTDYCFGSNPEFELQVRERRLLSNGQPVPLGSRALDVLIALVENAGELVSRRKLIDRVWGDLAVEENNLNVQVSALRRILGSHLIATIPGRGYCFTPRPSTPSQPQAGYTPERLKSNLPASLPRLIGREQDLAELDELTHAHRLVTILGAGGIGKTLLAQHLLRRHEARFRHGVCFVELSTLPDAQAIPGVIAAALRIQPSGGEPIAGLVNAIEPLEIMVVLDNAERFLEGVAHVARALHDAAPGLRLLVTSQAPLKLAAERLHRVQALSVPRARMSAQDALSYGAVALFVDRAQAADSRFVLTDEAAPAAIDLCAALDGLPLAIELAAWRAPTLGVQSLVESMHQPLRLLATSNLDVPQRLRTLRNALAWSHGLLDEREQIVLRRLSVLVGSSDLGLIQSVVCDPRVEGPIDESAAMDALSTLVERSLVTVVPGWRTELRYKLLDTPKAFAKEQLVAANEEALIGRRHAMALAAHFRRAHQDRFSGGVGLGEWQERQMLEVDNGHAALEWMRAHEEVDLAVNLLPGLMHSTPREEGAKHRQMITLAA